MTDNEKIKAQKEQGVPITQDMLNTGDRRAVYFTSGREIQEGDYMLFGLLTKFSDKMFTTPDGQEIPEVDIEMISFHEDEIGKIYQFSTVHQGHDSSFLPFLDKIED